jgi:malonate-semialdehyde dehydrogenase (acetylating)/methylmalonate-semialdehyde dehydrogenase
LKVPGYEGGYYLGPTIFENVSIHMQIAKEESFGPICNLIRAKSLDEAIEWINYATPYGHSACVVTQSGKIARRFLDPKTVTLRWE